MNVSPGRLAASLAPRRNWLVTFGNDAECGYMSQVTQGLALNEGPLRSVAKLSVLRARIPRVVGGGELFILIISIVALGWRVWAPSPWWDEAVTRYAISLSLPDLIELSSHVDLVHLLYYLFGHLVYLVLGKPRNSDSIYVTMRLVSVLASSVTVVLLYRTARMISSSWVGGLAVCLFLVSPFAVRFSQEARSYALVGMFAMLATFLLIRWIQSGRNRLHWSYAASLSVACLLNEVSGLIVVGHLVICLLMRARVKAWIISVFFAMLPVLPLIIFSSGQSGQVSWLYSPNLKSVADFFRYYWDSATLAAILVVAAGVVISRRSKQSLEGPRLIIAIGLTISVLPTVVLWLGSQAIPLFVPRYLFFTLSGMCLVAAGVAALMPKVSAVALVALLFVTSYPLSHAYRQAVTGHGENIKGTAAEVKQNSQPGDAVVFIPGNRRIVKLGYPEAFATVDDVALVKDPDSLYGTERGVDALSSDLESHSRIWVVSGKKRLGDVLSVSDKIKQQVLKTDYVPVSVYNTRTYSAVLYGKRDTAPPGPPVNPASLAQCDFCPGVTP